MGPPARPAETLQGSHNHPDRTNPQKTTARTEQNKVKKLHMLQHLNAHVICEDKSTLSKKKLGEDPKKDVLFYSDILPHLQNLHLLIAHLSQKFQALLGPELVQ